MNAFLSTCCALQAMIESKSYSRRFENICLEEITQPSASSN